MIMVITKVALVLISIYFFISLISFVYVDLKIKRNKIQAKKIFNDKEYDIYVKVKKDSSIKNILRMMLVCPRLLLKRKSNTGKDKYVNGDSHGHTVTESHSCSGMATHYINPNLKEQSKNSKNKEFYR
ncbi:hypothetical protein R9X47_00280 [Wukongibacter baidiensis]|uniref:hypothetical protein n=1 Tax=Wukongibacter baidiensis TaxID=1723361 RepID=UPI003D7FACB9